MKLHGKKKGFLAVFSMARGQTFSLKKNWKSKNRHTTENENSLPSVFLASVLLVSITRQRQVVTYVSGCDKTKDWPGYNYVYTEWWQTMQEARRILNMSASRSFLPKNFQFKLICIPSKLRYQSHNSTRNRLIETQGDTVCLACLIENVLSFSVSVTCWAS